MHHGGSGPRSTDPGTAFLGFQGTGMLLSKVKRRQDLVNEGLVLRLDGGPVLAGISGSRRTMGG